MMGEDKAIVMRAYELSSTGDFERVTEQVDQDAPTRLIDNFITSKRPLRRSYGLPDLNIGAFGRFAPLIPVSKRWRNVAGTLSTVLLG